ncbi:unnamed protein product [Adineta steineri]|uniref:F-box domain-containing protein n=1 Tax=Adineta steineri TaxID=433720 RepID=A0A813W7A4_9BILA|nr:unnamed protein product [Adineta steineri]
MESLQKKTLNMNCLSKQSITHFEDLSNEIFYEIFGHLDYFHVYQSFFNLNIRFRKFLTCSNVLIKINISSISKSNLEHYYTNTIILYPHRIISLCITNKFCYDLHISPHHILSRFIRLETLILENIDTKYLSNTFRDISTLSNLSTLIITCLGYIRDANQYLLQLFRLPALKYCKVSLPERYQSNPLPFATNEYSPIEYLVIKHKVYLQNIDRLLSYIPQIRRLSLDNFVANNEYELNHPIMLNHLTHLFLKLDGLSFNNFKLLIKTFFSTIEVLHLSVYGKEEYINANQWQELILTSMPFLRVFNICVRSSISLLSMSQLNEFKSSFWHDRQWFFTHQGYLARSFYIPTFYSVNPYRQKKYIIRWDNKQFTDLTDTKTDHTSVNHVYITGERSIYRCKHKFSNATELTLENVSSKRSQILLTTLKQMISLQNLTQLKITSHEYSFEKLIELLLLTPNIITLNIYRILLDEIEFIDIQNTENFQLVSNTNIIKNLTIIDIKEVKEVKLLFILCPRLQHFAIHRQQRHAAAIVRFLSSRFNDIAQYLVSLSFSINNTRCVETLNELIQTKQCLHDYFMKVENRHVYLWR